MFSWIVHEFTDILGHKKIFDIQIEAAPTIHSLPNLAYAISHNGKKLAYSGDGKISSESRQLFDGADLLVHEAYLWKDILDNHGSICSVISMVKSIHIKTLALVHIYEDFRKNNIDNQSQKFAKDMIEITGDFNFPVLFPKEMDTWQI